MARDWVSFYYAEPEPERFVEEVRALAASGALTDPDRSFAIVTFLSRVIAANPAKARGWLDALSGLPAAERRGVETAIWMSGVPEAQACLAGRIDAKLLASPPPDVLALEIDGPQMLDALWSYYFATGDTRAVRRVVSALEYMADYGAAEAFRQSAQTDADRARAVRDAMFQAASWSISTLMRQHPPLATWCGELVRSGNLTSNERVALATILAAEDPERWHVEIDHETKQAVVGWSDDG